MIGNPVEEGAVPEVSTQKLRAEREGKLAGLMERLDLDALICLSGGARGQRGNVRFLANYATTSQSSCALWAREGLPRLLVPYSVHRYWAESMSWIEDIEVTADYPRAIARYLKERGITHAKVGWTGPPLLVDAVHMMYGRLLPETETVMVQDAFSHLRAVKTEEELKLVRQSAAIADRILEKVEREIRPGVSTWDLVAEAEYVARRLGSEGASILVSKGSAMPNPMPQHSMLEPGDVVQLSVEPEGPGGFWVQTVRMYTLGEPPRELMQLVEKGLEAERQGASLARDGVGVARVAETMTRVLNQSESELRAPLGHGIGLDNSEPPRISIQSAGRLQAGMTIVIHPTEYAERSAIFLGNTYLVGRGAAEKLSGHSSELVVI
jgi:Xaa-Pro aminopeptidase